MNTHPRLKAEVLVMISIIQTVYIFRRGLMFRKILKVKDQLSSEKYRYISLPVLQVQALNFLAQEQLTSPEVLAPKCLVNRG